MQPGESLWGIAQAYGVTLQTIVEANQIPEPNRLVVGQALVIPTGSQFYIVQPGDNWAAFSGGLFNAGTSKRFESK